MFCKDCGKDINEHRICPHCHSLQGVLNDLEDNIPLTPPSPHSCFTAGILQIFLGAFGLGRFYLGYTKIGVLQILSTLFSFGILGFIWGIFDGILILNGKEKLDAKGRMLF